jgi:hypothetical protein
VRPGRAVAAAHLALVLALAGCGVSAPPASPGASGPAPSATPRPDGGRGDGPGLEWVTAVAVERPAGMAAEAPSIPPVTGGGLGHPGHFSGQGYPVALAAVEDRFLAVGYTYPEWRGVTWTSTDRQTWDLAELPGGWPETFPLSVAAAQGDRVVIVGRRGPAGLAWLSLDGGATWREAPGDGFATGPETRLTSVVAAGGQLLAGGWSGLFTEPATGRIWTSPDGAAWADAVGDRDDGAGDVTGADFADGRIAALAAGPRGIVAVGSTGPLGAPTGGAAWYSPDGRTWQRASAPSLRDGTLHAVTAGPDGGFVAVGTSLDSTAARAWTSDDGRAWTPAPDQPSLTFHGLRIVMDGVTAGPAGYVAVGHFLFGSQYGQGSAWTSPDGRTWTRADDDIAALGQGEPLAVIPDGGGGFVAVGTVGAPDNAIPTVWLSPAP